MKSSARALVVLGLMLMDGAAWAHHSMSAVFDLNQRFTRTGTLAKTEWTNPHIHLSVDSRNDKGQVETWVFEGPAPNTFRGLHVGKTDFQNAIGLTLTLSAKIAETLSPAAISVEGGEVQGA